MTLLINEKIEPLTKAEIEQEKKDKLLNTLWHTKLNALAPAFVPRGVAR